jgi:uncharacterized RDD family membrane protein YckC
VVVAGLGPRLAGWFVDIVLAGLVSVVLLLVGLPPWSRGITLGVLLTANAVLLVAWRGGNLGNLALGTRVVTLEGDARVGVGRATVRWGVVAVPLVVAGFVGWWWGWPLWALAVFGPLAFTARHQGLHDLAASVVVVPDGRMTPRWTAAALLRRVRR